MLEISLSSLQGMMKIRGKCGRLGYSSVVQRVSNVCKALDSALYKKERRGGEGEEEGEREGEEEKAASNIKK